MVEKILMEAAKVNVDQAVEGEQILAGLGSVCTLWDRIVRGDVFSKNFFNFLYAVGKLILFLHRASLARSSHSVNFICTKCCDVHVRLRETAGGRHNLVRQYDE